MLEAIIQCFRSITTILKERFSLRSRFTEILRCLHKKRENIIIQTCILNDDALVVTSHVRGGDFFTFAMSELKKIGICLHSPYENFFNESDAQMSIEILERNELYNLLPDQIEARKQKYLLQFEIELINKRYNINPDIRKKIFDYLKLGQFPEQALYYIIFHRQYYRSYEMYIKELQYVLHFINRKWVKWLWLKDEFNRMLKKDMSNDELRFISLHAEYDTHKVSLHKGLLLK